MTVPISPSAPLATFYPLVDGRDKQDDVLPISETSKTSDTSNPGNRSKMPHVLYEKLDQLTKFSRSFCLLPPQLSGLNPQKDPIKQIILISNRGTDLQGTIKNEATQQWEQLCQDLRNQQKQLMRTENPADIGSHAIILPNGEALEGRASKYQYKASGTLAISLYGDFQTKAEVMTQVEERNRLGFLWKNQIEERWKSIAALNKKQPSLKQKEIALSNKLKKLEKNLTLQAVKNFLQEHHKLDLLWKKISALSDVLDEQEKGFQYDKYDLQFKLDDSLLPTLAELQYLMRERAALNKVRKEQLKIILEDYTEKRKKITAWKPFPMPNRSYYAPDYTQLAGAAKYTARALLICGLDLKDFKFAEEVSDFSKDMPGGNLDRQEFRKLLASEYNAQKLNKNSQLTATLT